MDQPVGEDLRQVGVEAAFAEFARDLADAFLGERIGAVPPGRAHDRQRRHDGRRHAGLGEKLRMRRRLGRGIGQIVAEQAFGQKRDAGDAAGADGRGVEAGRHVADTAARDRAEGRGVAGDAAGRGGADQRAVASHADAKGHGTAGDRRDAAVDAGGRRIGVGRRDGGADAEFAHRRLAGDERAGRTQPLDDGGIGFRHAAGKGGEAGDRGHARRVDHVVDGDRQAVQRADGAQAAPLGVEMDALAAGEIGVEPGEGGSRRRIALHPGGGGVGDLRRARGAPCQPLAQVERRQVDQ